MRERTYWRHSRMKLLASETRGMMHKRMDFTVIWMKCTKKVIQDRDVWQGCGIMIKATCACTMHRGRDTSMRHLWPTSNTQIPEGMVLRAFRKSKKKIMGGIGTRTLP